MVYTRNWNAGNEAVPADTDLVSAGAAEIRSFKVDVRERLDNEHRFALTDGDDQGIHQFVVDVTAARPTGLTGRLFMNSQKNTLDFYDGAAWNVVGIESGTRMLFHQTAAPVGWTKDTTANLNDTALRIVTGAVGSQTAAQAFSVAFASGRLTNSDGTTVTGATAATINNTDLNLDVSPTDINLAVAAHVLTTAELPAHTHKLIADIVDEDPISATNYIAKQSVAGGDSDYDINGTPATLPTLGISGSTGSGTGHTHNLTGTAGSHDHAITGSVNNHNHTSPTHTHTIATHTHTTNMAVNYHDVVICTKD